MLDDAKAAEFRERGFAVVPGFYDCERDIVPILRGIHEVIGLVRSKHGLPAAPEFRLETFDEGYPELLARDRRYASEVYDAVKQIPAFVRLVTHPHHDAAFRRLRDGSLPGVAAGGYGIRVDNPGEERFRADWHQEYHAQLRSPDGITFWSTLVPLTSEMGPVRFCVGSHKAGMLRVVSRDAAHPDKTGAYGLLIENRDEVVARYSQEAPIPAPGDAVLIDFAVVHASGFNVSRRSRWTSQIRYFNFRHPVGVRIGWCGSFAAGRDFAAVHPELVADE
ncbi:MAG: phytanoyl-CoA dioxygenase family protein [Planctomycetes bacterium]|nr:phytanoyl-CoA dioxygenase family protein [Planctomycetota bacterium]